MLTLRLRDQRDQSTWRVITPECAVGDLFEDMHYELRVERPHCRVFIDDVELLMAAGWFRWRPSFYSGRVCVTAIDTQGHRFNYFIDISPASKKSANGEFDVMVQTIRDFDQSLLAGRSAATMAFGNEGKTGLMKNLVLLARLRLHGNDFLDSVGRIAQSPHQRLSANQQQMPLSKVRRLHPAALYDRKLVGLISNPSAAVEQIENLQVHAWSSKPTVDTPANRALLALLKRFRGTVLELRRKVDLLELPEDKEEQKLRTARRLEELDALDEKAKKLIQRPPFTEVKSAEIGSAGLTQIAAQPQYNRAYRLGCAALTHQVNGAQAIDQLRVNFSWGIYETWCFLATLKCLEQVLGKPFGPVAAKSASALLGFCLRLAPDHSVELLFQASFPAQKANSRSAWSISRQRYPDIVIVENKGAKIRSMILDAKWRSGRANVLEAMESAHLYHDSLRIESQIPEPCLLLLPGSSDVESLADPAFIQANGVGAVYEFSAQGDGIKTLTGILEQWFSDGLIKPAAS